MRALRVFRVSKAFVVISDRKVIRAAKDRKEIWALRGQGGFQAQPVRLVQRALWDLKV